MISLQSFPWNPYLLPTLITLMWWCLIKIQHQRFQYLPLFSLLFGLSLQAHATALFLLPVFIFLIHPKSVPVKYWLVSGLSLILVLSPWIWVDLTTHFGQTRQALQVFTPTATEGCSLSFYLQHHGNGEHCFAEIRNTLFIGRMFTMSLFNTRNLFMALFSLGFIIWSLFKLALPHRQFFLSWIIIPWFLFMFYSSNIYLHYLLIFFPLPFLLLVQSLEYFKQQLHLSDHTFNLVYYFLILGNLISYGSSLTIIRG